MNDPPGYFTRGGEVLWKLMKEDLIEEPLPGEWKDLQALVKQSFNKHTEHEIDEPNHIYCKKLDKGGMSGGVVYPLFFKEVILCFISYQFSGGAYGKQYSQNYNNWLEKVSQGLV
ncbi:hypothetical protein [Glaciecola sp. KUL10]|uniref:hypothetical protein n=1 Tax=Glaciecola sp. (strain KUL10) TaxID=2161813 RepID=UPI0011B36C65|nr:hypothetical protein [Glaciecola sp. KUL10]